MASKKKATPKRKSPNKVAPKPRGERKPPSGEAPKNLEAMLERLAKYAAEHMEESLARLAKKAIPSAPCEAAPQVAGNSVARAITCSRARD